MQLAPLQLIHPALFATLRPSHSNLLPEKHTPNFPQKVAMLYFFIAYKWNQKKNFFILGYKLLMLQFCEYLERLRNRFCLPVAENSGPTPLRAGWSSWHCEVLPILQRQFPQLLPEVSPAGITAACWHKLNLPPKSIFLAALLSFWSCSRLKVECFRKHNTAAPCCKSKDRDCTLHALIITSTMWDQEQGKRVWF